MQEALLQVFLLLVSSSTVIFSSRTSALTALLYEQPKSLSITLLSVRPLYCSLLILAKYRKQRAVKAL